jgi:hypothetical protein
MPTAPNQVGIDSFILHDNNLYLFQMTVADIHCIKPNLNTFLLSLKGLPPQNSWKFIFVKPPGRPILKCPVPDGELLDLSLYSTEVEVM